MLRRWLPRQTPNRIPIAALLGSAPAAVTGDLTATLGAATLTSAGAASVAGTLTSTLAAATLTATAGAAAGATLTATLGAATVTATATAPVQATATATLTAATLSSTGGAGVTATLIATLGGATLSSKGLRIIGACVGGVLTVDSTNSRYFRNDSGIVVLSGFHTWYEFQDGDDVWPITNLFDYGAWLDFIDVRGANFHKMWVLETARQWSDVDHYFDPLPYARTGPGNAADGRLKFDLSQFNQAYFDRLRERVILAGNRGHYVAVQLYQGWNIDDKGFTYHPFTYHPYRYENNINGIDGDPNDDLDGHETRDTAQTAIIAYQQAYVRKVVDTLNDLDNVIWEISNEEDGNATANAWQYHWIDHIHTYEAGKAKQHPVGMTVAWPGGSNSVLTSSNAEWISTNDQPPPPVNSGTKVSLYDSDHNNPNITGAQWIWQSFTRGHNVLFMDGYDGGVYGNDLRANSNAELIRKNLGYLLDYAARLDLANATPQGSLSSTGYCLAKTTGRYQLLAYQDTSGAFTVNLTSLSGTFTLDWLRPSTGATQAGSNVSGGAVRTLTPPWSGEDAVALLELAGSNADLTKTLAAATLTGAAVVTVTATATATLGAATVTATATVTVQGALAATPTAATLAATATVAVQASAALALAAATLSAVGTVAVTASVAATLTAAPLTSTATVGNGASGSVAAALAGATLTSAATVAVQATATITTGAATLAGTGVVAVVGTLTSMLAAATVTAAAGSGNGAMLTALLAGATLTATGAALISAAATLTPAPATLNAAAVAPVGGALTATLGAAAVAATGSVAVAGNLAVTLATATLTANANVENPADVAGALAATLAPATLTAAALVVFVATLGLVTGPGGIGSAVGMGGAGTVSGPKTTGKIGR